MGVITLNGKTSTSIGLQVETPPDYEVAERLYESIPVPGRNGDVLMDTGAYKNVNRTYLVSLGEEGGNFALLAAKLTGWLHSGNGYVRLEDSYEPDVFKIARYSGETNIANILQQAGKANITFDRKPQRFLKSGDSAITVTSSRVFTNPTIYNAKPLIRVNGNGDGTVTVGGYKITLTNMSGYVDVDCDVEDAYKGGINMNRFVGVPDGFPQFVPGDSNVTFTGGVTSVSVTPRWWTI